MRNWIGKGREQRIGIARRLQVFVRVPYFAMVERQTESFLSPLLCYDFLQSYSYSYLLERKIHIQQSSTEPSLKTKAEKDEAVMFSSVP